MDRDKLQKLLGEAEKLHQEEKWSAAVAKWDEIFPLLLPDDVDANMKAYYHRGFAKNKAGDYAGAIIDFDWAVRLDPQYAKAYNSRGLANNSMGKYTLAIADFNEALAIDPQYVAAYNNCGIAKNNMGDHVGAIIDFNNALEVDPQHAGAYNNRGFAKTKTGDHASAIADFDKALEINPQLADAYNNRGSSKDCMGDHAAAIADFEEALKINPKDTDAIHNRAVALALQASDKDLEEIERKYQAQLQEQKERFDRGLQAKIKDAASAHEDIVKAFDYENNLRDYDKKFAEAEKLIRRWMLVLGTAATLIFGVIVGYYFDADNPFGTLPLVAMGSLVLSPLVWYLRMLNRDKQRYLVLREDARANLTLARIIKTNPGIHKELSARLFDHHDKRGSANLIAEWNRADTGGDNPVSVENIINRGDKSGGK